MCQTRKHNDDTSPVYSPKDPNWRHAVATALDAEYAMGLYPGAPVTKTRKTWRTRVASLATSRTMALMVIAASLIISGLILCMKDNSHSEWECEQYGRFITGVEVEYRFLDGCILRESGQEYRRDEWIRIRTTELREGKAKP